LQISSDESLSTCRVQEYCKGFTAALKIFDVFNKKQMNDHETTRKENASED